MDVLRRHRALVTVGLALTVALALISYIRVSPDGGSYRAAEGWSNDATLALSQPGFPELRVLPRTSESSPFATPEELASLVDLYAALATSDAVVAVLKRKGEVEPEDIKEGALPFSAGAVPSSVGGGSQLMRVTGTGTSPAEATALTIATTDAFLALVRRRQREANIPERQRVEVRVVKRSGEPVLIAPRSKTTPIVILLAGLTIVFAAAFVRDNARRTRSESHAIPDEARDGGDSLPEPVADPPTPAQAPAPAAAQRQAASQLHLAEDASEGLTATQARWSSGPTR
jgi:hypothetical protein